MDKSASKKTAGSAGKSSSKPSGTSSSTQSVTRKKLKSVKADPPVQNETGQEVDDLQDRFDALFLTLAAVEKFVVPFYNSREGARGDQGTRILNAFISHEAQVYALAHMPLCDAIFLVREQIAQKGRPGPTVLRMLTLEEVEQLP